MSNGCLWYSFGSDKTGPALAKALGFQASKKTPDFSKLDVVVGWGCKPGTKYNAEALNQRIQEGRIRVLNHPDAVEANRDKARTLAKLQEAGIAVPGFVLLDTSASSSVKRVSQALEDGTLAFPLVVLNQFNRGEPRFCFDHEEVSQVLHFRKDHRKREERFHYVRSYDHGTEYRIHLFRDLALWAQAKRPRENPLDATSKRLLEILKKKRERLVANGKAAPNLPQAGTLKWIIDAVAGEVISSSSQLKKSVALGWEYRDIPLEEVPASVVSLALDALDVAELDLGAVSLSFNSDSVARVLSITTAPALAAEQMQGFVEEIGAFAKAKTSEKKKRERKESDKAPPELVARIYQKARVASAGKAREALKSLES